MTPIKNLFDTHTRNKMNAKIKYPGATRFKTSPPHDFFFHPNSIIGSYSGALPHINARPSERSLLPQQTKSFFQPGYGYDFSDGNTIFNQHGFSAETHNGKRSLLNDLTHLVQQENMNQSTPGPVIQKPPTAAPGKGCTEPTSVTIDQSRTQQMQYPGYGTGANLAGICVVMKAFPETDNLCPNSIYEEVKPTEESTCPDGLIKNACSGNSTFSPGGKQKLCDIETSASEFTDRHSMQVGVSVLHDKTRNPKNLRACKYVCHQDYLSVNSKNILGSFQIIYELSKAKQDKNDVTDVKVTKVKI